MKKHKKYQDYVIKNGKLIGEFEEMYKDFDDPWEQSKWNIYPSEKAVCINIVESFKCQNVIELGCGLGHLSGRLSKVAPSVTGLDISPTAIKKAEKKYPNCNFHVSKFPDIDLIRSLAPDCIIMAEITWYVLNEIDDFLSFLESEMPNTLLIHLLTTYKEGDQKYGADKFTNLAEIKEYFGMNYFEWGEFQSLNSRGVKRTYFAGNFKGS